jgi:cell division protein FtsI (penicillin-binding protein 3)
MSRSPFSKLSMRIKGEKSSTLDLARGRIVLIVALFMMVYIVVAARLVDATLIQGYLRQHDEMSALDKEQDESKHVAHRRADIVDRNGILLATSLKTASLYADPKIILDPAGTAKSLVRIFPDLTYGETLRRLQGSKRFVWIKRNLTPEEQKKILEIGDPGLAFEYDFRRFYPQGHLAGHMVGYSDVDGRGLAGVERSFNKMLSAGDKPIQLTLDIRLQHVMRRELQRAIESFTAKAGAGVIMDVKTGEILAAVSLPDFDPHSPSSNPSSPEMFNRVTLGVYELGSIFKMFTTAAVLEKTSATMATNFDASKPLQRYGHRISDYHPEKRPLTIPEIFMHSSNIGTALMGEMVGTQGLRDLYRDLGLMKKEEFEIDEVGTPLMPNPWREINTLTASYGHGIAVTPMQLVAAAGAIVNGGYLVKPTIVKAADGTPDKKSYTRVIRQETSLKMRQLMRLVVTEGTGKNADVPGYMVGGKTGTADKNVNGRYVGDKRISSFMGVFPANDPKYIVFVMVDEPHGNKKSYGFATAGWVAAPAVGRVISSMAPLLNLKPLTGQPEISEPLEQFISIKAAER